MGQRPNMFKDFNFKRFAKDLGRGSLVAIGQFCKFTFAFVICGSALILLSTMGTVGTVTICLIGTIGTWVFLEECAQALEENLSLNLAEGTVLQINQKDGRILRELQQAAERN